ncbi:MAG: 2-dehydropantoate 2-reductase [Candidatus Promineifilaceae bacterium]
MKIVIVGAGGVGGYFGGLLAKSGQDVTFLARGAHLDAIRENGLRVKSVHGDFLIKPAKATDEATKVGPTDLVLVCVKDYQLDDAIEAVKHVVGQQTVVIPLLNGVRAAERLAEKLGRERLMGGLCRVVSFKTAPGVIEQVSSFRSLTFGEWNCQETARAQAIYQVMQEAEIEAELSNDIRKAMWTKFLFITAYSGVASVVRLPAAQIRSCPETMTMMRQAMEEIEAVARALGVNLDEDIMQKSMTFFDGFPGDATASMQRDVQDGRIFELEAMTGSLIRYGVKSGVPTPVNDFIYAALKPQEVYVRNRSQPGSA